MATTTATATAPRRRRSWRWVLATLLVLAVIAGVDAYLSAPRPGTRMDAASTDPDGAHALVALLRDGGVDVVVADHIADVESAARPDTLILVAQSQYLADSVLDRLARIRSDLLLVEPTSEARKALLPGVRISGTSGFDSDPDCTLREAVRAGSVRFGRATTYESEDGRAMTRCYDGALIRFRDGGRAITAVGSTEFMTNASLLQAGNAALAMNLAGGRPRLIWYAPHFVEGESSSKATVLDLIPANVYWVVGQLAVVVLLVAVWRGRRPGPLVAEELPVVVRASETVEGRGRLYRSRRARDRAAAALRTAALQRLTPKLGLAGGATPEAVVSTASQRTGSDPGWVSYHLFGPPPTTDHDLLQLARALDDIERQVAHP
ncbi:DUF4350 domain-containing protein [Mycobacterium avium subsp. hominissuis]|uniref:DUF4350 domain-containing protein n=1 Tax=Mycobacterium avium TaxID=1764 RepID=UPI0003925489|nr:DUF4350 domain-containing protein [Mycobacterium avium]ETA94465.1 membrane protein [Mycobacterium avium 10-5581]ATO61184.1 DUF4350 domain-containing protein [Mycobacterium avium subsp. hominissuis]ATO65743.1 DUF4350 domain-containing protein [Mycobacterium avium subsp. hominissuis]ATO70319.1 DUF4350 domain-containing protein [Mycobacterium avium subsp. hominissuis]PBJ29590.1 DUF4350 domain-containing protein [Mycobacterium avium subsp. hominissuis]